MTATNYENKVKKYYDEHYQFLKPSSKIFTTKLEYAEKHLPKNCVLLDAGCGTGYFTIPLAKKCKKVIAVDFSNKMIIELRKKTKNLRNIEIKKADILKLPFGNNSFDAIICFSTFYYVRDHGKLLKEFSRVLKKNGILILDAGLSRSLGAVYSSKRFQVPQFFTTRKKLAEILAENGLKIVEERFFELIPKIGALPVAKIVDIKLGDKTIDEIISSAPLAKRFAFRELLLCKKTEK